MEAKTKISPEQAKGVVRGVGQSSLPTEFITIGKTLADTTGRTVIRDAKQHTAISAVCMHTELFNKHAKMEIVRGTIKNHLDLAPAEGGHNRALASMTYSDLFDGEAAGVKTSKTGAKSLAEQYNRRVEHEHDGGDSNGR